MTFSVLALGAGVILANATFRLWRSRSGGIDWVVRWGVPVVLFLFVVFTLLYARPLWERSVVQPIPNWLLAVLLVVLTIVGWPLARFVFRRSVCTTLPAAVGLISLVVLAAYAFGEASFHFDGDSFVEAFETPPTQLASASNVAFRRSDEGTTHVIGVSPSLVRAYHSRDLDLMISGRGEVSGGMTEMPFARLVADRCRSRPRCLCRSSRTSARCARSSPPRRTALRFSQFICRLVVLFPCEYVARMEPLDRVRHSGQLRVGVYRRRGVEDGRRPPFAHDRQIGWTTLFFGLHLGLLVGIYLVWPRTPGNPVLGWLAAYCFAGALLWLATSGMQPVDSAHSKFRRSGERMEIDLHTSNRVVRLAGHGSANQFRSGCATTNGRAAIGRAVGERSSGRVSRRRSSRRAGKVGWVVFAGRCS